MLSGRFSALEYDRSITLENVTAYVAIHDTDRVEIPTSIDHRGYISAHRKNMIIPGKLI